MRNKRILVVDDERDLCEILVYNLNAAEYHTDVAHSAEDAMKLQLTDYDLILLDVMMGKMSGFQFAEMLKSEKTTAKIPIIFLTAKNTEDDTLQGFDLGADDYITKPFSTRELIARVKAVLNRTEQETANVEEEIYSYKGLVVNTTNNVVTVDNKDVRLTRTEYKLLLVLLKNKGTVFSRQQLIVEAWPENAVVSDRAVDVNITRMRKKIGKYSTFIVTRQGFGYSFSI